jgi:dTDP-4-amino-4,6-dideoxygalactose transaminase
VKIVTSGEGGIALTNDPMLAQRMAEFRSHGITRAADRLRAPDAGAWAYEQQALGYNYRLTDLAAALGLSQLRHLAAFVERRNVLADAYDRALEGLPLRRLTVREGNRSAFHLYVVRVSRGIRRRVFDRLRGAGVGVNVHYTPVHLQPYYRDLGFGPGDCPEAEAHGAEAITLPLYPSLRDEDQQSVVAALVDALRT